MSVSLNDVSTILGIPVTGTSVSTNKLSRDEAAKVLVKSLGVLEDDAVVELKGARGQSVRLEWLHEKFKSVSNMDSDDFIHYATRAYLLFLLGCTLFVDKTINRAPVVYLQLLEDLDLVHSYAWGAVILAFFYRRLGMATKSTVRQKTGYMTLLEAWIYEHFICARTHPNLNYAENQPRAYCWIPHTQSGSSVAVLKSLREELDRLEAHKVKK
ncbi:protein MAIN-LIKE 1-like [Camellia sinensis]|uniref:protein MAIN-LIKE 1-like n=1 Tax=Camellia sinensis TaxID=4442 RepID=UPI00103597C9|nr:protein MAIN-LIKE 1-like [Camellia sinensis]